MTHSECWLWTGLVPGPGDPGTIGATSASGSYQWQITTPKAVQQVRAGGEAEMKVHEAFLESPRYTSLGPGQHKPDRRVHIV